MTNIFYRRTVPKEQVKKLINFNIKDICYEMTGVSPPSVFVGHIAYPKVNIGPLISPFQKNVKILDSPEEWNGKSIDDILMYRLSLVRGTKNADATMDLHTEYIRRLQELILSSESLEIEAIFENKPSEYCYDYGKPINCSISNLNDFNQSAKIKDFRIHSSIPSSNKKIEYVFYDTDLRSRDAINLLYKENIPISKIVKILSTGMMGLIQNRKLVPTKWSITIVDKSISSQLLFNISSFPSIDFFEVYKFDQLGNNYSIIFIPSNNWSYEMHECWIDEEGKMIMGMDFENSDKVINHPKIGGSYFAGKLAVAEYLNIKRKKASVIIFREVSSIYSVSVGVWQVREGIRNALRMGGRKFETFEDALTFSCFNLRASKNIWIKNSRLYKFMNEQVKISKFF